MIYNFSAPTRTVLKKRRGRLIEFIPKEEKGKTVGCVKSVKWYARRKRYSKEKGELTCAKRVNPKGLRSRLSNNDRRREGRCLLPKGNHP